MAYSDFVFNLSFLSRNLDFSNGRIELKEDNFEIFFEVVNH